MTHAFGDLLRQHCARKRGLSQTRLAELAGYDRAILVRMAQGKKDLTGPSGRERVVRLIETLADEGALTTRDEANALLKVAAMPPLFEGQPAEMKLMSRLAHTSNHKQQQVRRSNLPAPLGHFIGRAQEGAEVQKLLASTRLLTLTGSGGVGKTRLAQHVAGNLVFKFGDGAWYVELAALTDGALLAQAVAPAFDLAVAERSAYGQVIDYLRDRQALLVLDNCEHLIDAVATFTLSLLRACPRLTVLATSREALNVEGETAWRVPPMQPDDAAQLFVERAQAARSDLTLDVGDATIVHICQRLDGMPLAIELAVARLQGMSLNELTARLDDRFALLTGGQRGALPRHQTLRAVIDWSYDLLSEPERILFRSLSVFAGGWTTELAEQVCSNGLLAASSVLPLLLNLVRKTLVAVEERDGQTRYHYLETIREYGWQKLVEHGEMAMMQHRHAEAFAALAEESYKPLRGPEQRAWLARLQRDYPNLRAALAWSFSPQGDALVGCRIFANPRVFWLSGSHLADARHWAGMSRNALTEGMPPRICGSVWQLTMDLDVSLTPEQRLAGFQRALAYYTAAGDPSGMADATGNIGTWMLVRNPLDPEGWRLIKQGVTLARVAGDMLVEHCLLKGQAECAAELKEYDWAEALFQENLHLCRETSDFANLSLVLMDLARLHMEQLQFREALPYAQEAAEVAQQINDHQLEIEAKCFAADNIRHLGDAQRAVALNEAYLAFARDELPPTDYATAVHALTKALNDAGEHNRAQSLLVEWLKTIQRIEGFTNCWYWGFSMDILACVASGQGKSAQAARLFGVADGIIAAAGMRRSLLNEWEYAPYIAKARAALGDAAYEVARAEGRAMTPAQAVKYALAM